MRGAATDSWAKQQGLCFCSVVLLHDVMTCTCCPASVVLTNCWSSVFVCPACACRWGVADPTTLVVVGAAAVLGAACRAPLTAFGLMVEITRCVRRLLSL